MSKLLAVLDAHLKKTPVVGKDVYIAQGAVVVGDVILGDAASVWYNTVLRGDINRIEVGHHTNIQDNTVIHLSEELPCILGNYVTVGHAAILHACTIGDETLIGMGATILDGAVIGKQCIIGANALVTQGMQVPDGSLVLGCPAKVVKALSPEKRATLKPWAEEYSVNGHYHLQNKINVGKVTEFITEKAKE